MSNSSVRPPPNSNILFPTTPGLTRAEIKEIQTRFLVIVVSCFFSFLFLLIAFVFYKTWKQKKMMQQAAESQQLNTDPNKPVLTWRTSIAPNGTRVTLIERRGSNTSDSSRVKRMNSTNPPSPQLLPPSGLVLSEVKNGCPNRFIYPSQAPDNPNILKFGHIIDTRDVNRRDNIEVITDTSSRCPQLVITKAESLDGSFEEIDENYLYVSNPESNRSTSSPYPDSDNMMYDNSDTDPLMSGMDEHSLIDRSSGRHGSVSECEEDVSSSEEDAGELQMLLSKDSRFLTITRSVQGKGAEEAVYHIVTSSNGRPPQYNYQFFEGETEIPNMKRRLSELPSTAIY